MLRAEPVSSENVADSNERLQRSLASVNARRFAPRRTAGDFDAELDHDVSVRRSERAFVEAERAAIKNEARVVPTRSEQFAAWFESLPETHCAASDALSSWLASEATGEQVEWFDAQPRHHDVSVKDLLALTQLNMPASSRLEPARTYWQAMSEEPPRLFQRKPSRLVEAAPPPAAWEALAVDNLMVALATARHYAYQSLGALGTAEHTGRRHSAHFLHEVLAPLVAKDPSLAPLIAEGALMRLRLVSRRDARYLQLLKASSQPAALFEYAEDGPAPPQISAVRDAPPAVRPVHWPDVSGRAAH